MEKWDNNNLDEFRNYYLAEGDYGGALFLQALSIKVLECKASMTISRGILRQEYSILQDLTETIFSDSTENMRELLLELAGLMLLEPESGKYRKACGRIVELFPEIWEQQADVILAILLRNKELIKNEWGQETQQRYTDNVLDCIRTIYGYESKEYASIYLHLLCESDLEDVKKYKDEFIENYGYFKKYLEGYDVFYVSCLCLSLVTFLEENEEQYRYWLPELERAIMANRANREYSALVCQFAYLKALEYEKRKDSKAVVNILKKAICLYIIPNTVQNNAFHIKVLQKAAFHCSVLFDYETMAEYARKGVDICEQLGIKETEMYYEIYNFIGYKMICGEQYMEAQEFYAKNSREIERKFGRNCVNYILYINNLGLVYLLQRKINSAIQCFDEAASVEGEDLEDLKRDLVFRNLHWIESMGGENSEIFDTYVKKYANVKFTKMGISSEIGIQIMWLITCLTDKKVDFAEIDEPFKKMYTQYKQHNIPENVKVSCEVCIVLYQWRKNRKLEALKLCYEAVQKCGRKIYSYANNTLAIIFLKLLVDNGQYEKAKDFGERLIDYRYDEIVDRGIGDITPEIISLRISLSYYICLIDQYMYSCYQNEAFCIRLVERIANCKTVEKDIRSFLGKYESGQENIDFDLYKWRDLHRKINALEMRRDIIKGKNSDDGERQLEEIDQKIFKYDVQIAELEGGLQKEINLKDHVKKMEYKDFCLPNQTLAMEFFAYLDLDFDAQEIDFDNLDVRYICFALSYNQEQKTVRYAGSYNDKEYMLQEYYDYFFNGENADEQSVTEIKLSFENAIRPVIEPYIERTQTVYWGMDAEMHLIPIEWILGEKYKDIVNIHVDSVKYIRNDEKLDIGRASSLIMGNPQYAIGNDVPDEYTKLLCSEIECREIAKIIKGTALVGAKARQQEFNRNFDKDIIHISTHGKMSYVEDIFSEKNKLKYIHILLAGYSDWCAERTVEGYGNGTITADDVSYADMRNTKLAVVAACLTNFANVNILLGNIYGFRWALGIAGVHFSVTTLWETDDIATSIFMTLFYRYLKVASVGEAFHMAKIRLRSLRREEIKSDSVMNSLFEQYDNAELGREHPFSRDKYWAGFVCYCS
ncbi:CHAT domain-containing protein [bacterium 1xD42-87]|nr:CHAT domain-containing protein [bacterium 1xD42-87]